MQCNRIGEPNCKLNWVLVKIQWNAAEESCNNSSRRRFKKTYLEKHLQTTASICSVTRWVWWFGSRNKSKTNLNGYTAFFKPVVDVLKTPYYALIANPVRWPSLNWEVEGGMEKNNARRKGETTLNLVVTFTGLHSKEFFSNSQVSLFSLWLLFFFKFSTAFSQTFWKLSGEEKGISIFLVGAWN